MSFSCGNAKEKTDTLFKSFTATLTKANKSIKSVTDQNFQQFEERLRSPEMGEHGILSLALAEKVRKNTTRLITYIDSTKSAISTDPAKFSDDRLSRLFGLKNSAIADHLDGYQKDILGVDSFLWYHLSRINFPTLQFLDHGKHGSDSAFATHLSPSSVAAAIAILTKFEYEALVVESIAISMIFEKNIYEDLVYDSYSAIIGQNSQQIKAGNKLMITAGMGEFNRKTKSKVFINDIEAPMSSEGVAEYALITPFQPGQYTAIVKIIYFNKAGKQEVINKTIKYTVVK